MYSKDEKGNEERKRKAKKRIICGLNLNGLWMDRV
jgi:hypothetical protein